MYSAADATTEAARVWFIFYMSTITLMVANLIVGVVLDVYGDIQKLHSRAMYNLLLVCCGDVTDTERQLLKEQVDFASLLSGRFASL